MTRFAFFEGEIVPLEQAKVSVMTHGLNYGTGCFGGLRAYWNAERENLYVFRMADHYERFLQSSRLLLMTLPYTVEDLSQVTLALLRREGWREDVYIRPLAYKASELIGVRLHNLRDAVTMFSLPFGRYVEAEEGARVVTSSWRRIEDVAIPARGKLVGSYINSALTKSEAVLGGYDDAVVLNQNGHVSEGSAANIFIVRGGVLITPPVTDNILEGITRRSVMEIATADMGLSVMERSIDRTELYVADEAFFCGTGFQITAIASVDQRPVGEGRMGPIVSELRERFFAIVRGNNPAYRAWVTPVYG